MYIGAPRFSRVTNSLLRTLRDTPRGLRRSGLPSRTLTHCKYEATHRPKFLEESAQAIAIRIRRSSQHELRDFQENSDRGCI
jgi:hypothetical protein